MTIVCVRGTLFVSSHFTFLVKHFVNKCVTKTLFLYLFLLLHKNQCYMMVDLTDVKNSPILMVLTICDIFKQHSDKLFGIENHQRKKTWVSPLLSRKVPQQKVKSVKGKKLFVFIIVDFEACAVYNYCHGRPHHHIDRQFIHPNGVFF